MINRLTRRDKILRQRKAQLLKHMQADRHLLQQNSVEWLQLTAPVDQGWQAMVRYKPVVLGAAAFLAIRSLRQPLRLVRWSRKALSLWSSYQLLKRVGSKL